MTDDVKELIEPAGEWDARVVRRNPEKAARYIRALAAALESATVAPAVDREALARELYVADFWGDENAHRDWDELIAHPVHVERYRARAKTLIASGVLRDVRDVQAEALEQVRDEIRSLACWTDPATGRSGFNLGNDEDGEAGARMAVLDILAQAIREARSER